MSIKKLNDLSIESEGEYFFDDQFAVPFDANLKDNNKNQDNEYNSNIQKLGSFSKDYPTMSQSLSESCIYSDLGSSFQEFPDVLDDLLDGKLSKSIFSPLQSNSEADPKESLMRSFTQSSVYQDLLSKHLSRDYRITFENKPFPTNRPSVSSNANYLSDSDNTEITKITWNQIDHVKNTSLLKCKTKNEVKAQVDSNLNEKVISWTKLKGESSSSKNNLLQNKDSVKRSRSPVKSNFLMKESCNSDDLKCRAHSEPRVNGNFTGTLFQIYSKSRKFGCDRTQSNADLTNDGNINNNNRKEFVNFGAQFPPTLNESATSVSRCRSFGTLEKKVQNYPGLGVINVPKSTRLKHSAFLSKTLPDLSFLTTGRLSTDSQTDSSKRQDIFSELSDMKLDRNSDNYCFKCQSSISNGPFTNDLIKLDEMPDTYISHHMSVPNFKAIDLLTGSPLKKDASQVDVESREENIPLKSCLRYSLDRSISEPDFVNSKSKGSTCISESICSSNSDFEQRTHKAKKSVSFSENSLKKPLSPLKYYSCSFNLLEKENMLFTKPQEIPKNLGLYGHESNMISEFFLGSHLNRTGKENEISNEDVRYKMLVRDIIKAVQETLATYSDQKKADDIKHMKSPPLFIVDPMYNLLTDGILPYQKNSMMNKNRNRLWSVVEASSTNVDQVSEIIKSMKKSSTTNEKQKFKAFITQLLSHRLLQKWFSELLKNESVLKNNYSKESFLRQVNSNLKGLYADLDTNLQLLNSLPNLITNLTVQNRDKFSSLKPVTSVKSLKKSNFSMGRPYDANRNKMTLTTTAASITADSKVFQSNSSLKFTSKGSTTDFKKSISFPIKQIVGGKGKF